MAVLDWFPYVQFAAQASLVAGAVFAGYQFLLHRRQRSEATALELLSRLQTAEFREAYTHIWDLPLGATADTIREKGLEHHAEVVAYTFESVGVMVHNHMVPLEVVDQVIGGFLRESWRRLGPYVEWKRQKIGSQRWAEWYQWLAERLGVDQRRVQGAYKVFKDWKP